MLSLLTHPFTVHLLSFLQDDYMYGSEEGGPWLWLLGPIGGTGFFMWVFLRYRNTDKRHAFERETASDVLDLKVYDQKTGEVNGTTDSRIRGRNSNAPRTRLGSGSTVTVVPVEPAAPTQPSAEPQASAPTAEPPAAEPPSENPPAQ